MLEYRQSRLEMEPINCNNVTPSIENLDSLEFRRVVCKGVFDESKSVYVGPRSRSISGVTENGYYLITPLMPLPNNSERLVQHHFYGYNLYIIHFYNSFCLTVKTTLSTLSKILLLFPLTTSC